MLIIHIVIWNAVKHFLSNKDAISNENIIAKAQKEEKVAVKTLENEIHIDANQLIKYDEILVELFNNLYVNIAEKTSGLGPNCICNQESPSFWYYK